MSEQWEKDLSESTEIFKETVYPKIKTSLGSGELVPVESVTDSNMAETLDTLGGVDFWYVDSDKGMYGLASRVQPNGTDWSTFTVRRNRYSGTKTEFEKRKEQINEGYLYPQYTCQSYTDGTDFINAAYIKTKDLIEFIENGQRGDEDTINNTHNADFFVVDWDRVARECNIDIQNTKNQSLTEWSE